MRFHLIENPSAGRGRVRAYLDGVISALRDGGHEVTRRPGGDRDDMVREVAALGAGAVDRLVVAGGDGTVSVVVNAQPEPGLHPIGILPIGTANLAARETGMFPLPPPGAAAERLVQAEPWRVDVLEVRRDGNRLQRAIAAVSAGIDARIVHDVEHVRRTRPGSGGYTRWLGPIGQAIRARSYPVLEVEVDGGPPERCTTVIVQNAFNYGGVFTLSPQACLDSGVLDVVAVRVGTARDVARLFAVAMARRFHRDRNVRVLRGRHVHIRAERSVHVQVDGDPFGFTDLEVSLRPGAVELLRARRTR